MADYRFASISEIHTAYRSRELTVRELVLTFLDAIAKLDQGEDGLHAVMEVNPDALFIADAMDRQLDSLLSSGTVLPPLFGIPILLKDNINTADRMHTTAGTLALNDLYAPYDATITAKLRAAGSLIHEYKACMNEYLDSVREATDIHAMADIIAFNEAHAAEAIHLNQATAFSILLSLHRRVIIHLLVPKNLFHPWRCDHIPQIRP